MSKWKDGLPPVGEWCLVEWNHKFHEQINPIFFGDKTMVFKDRSGKERCGFLSGVDSFSPLKSEADRKRDEAVEEMIDAVNLGPKYDSNMLCVQAQEKTFIQLHDAGYRKVKPLTDEQIDDCTCCDLTLYDSRSLAAGAKWARSHILGEES